MLQTYWSQGSPKTYLLFTPDFIYHIFSKLFVDHIDFTPHLKFVKIYLTGRLFSLVSMVKISETIYKISFILKLITLSIKKNLPPPQKEPKAVKDRGGGGGGSFDRGQRFNVFFKPSLILCFNNRVHSLPSIGEDQDQEKPEWHQRSFYLSWCLKLISAL